MSKEIKVTTDLDAVNENYLGKFDYQDLEKVFKKLGVPAAWKAGKKKVDMIKEAMSQLTFLKSALDTSETKTEKVVEVKAEVKEVKKETVAKAVNIDTEQKIINLKQRIKNIDANLDNNVVSHRTILLQKRKEAEDELKKLA